MSNGTEGPAAVYYAKGRLLLRLARSSDRPILDLVGWAAARRNQWRTILIPGIVPRLFNN